MMRIALLWICLTSFLKGFAQSGNQTTSGIEHVIVIGVDGLSPDGIKKSNTPVLDKMIAKGSVKWNVRTVLTSSSSQNWASMIMGAGPEQHGIINNDWEIDDHSLPPIVQESDGRFPTIFSILREQKPQAEIGAVYHWSGFGRLFQKNVVNYDARFKTEDSTAAAFVKYIQDKKPTLGFVHFDHVDHAGHHGGHGSQEYYQSVSKADSLIGDILEAIKKAGIENKTLVIIWADHGGLGTGHGGATLQEAEIAGILSGKNIRKGYEVKQQVYTYDLAATIAFALNITPPYAWIGRPIKAAFDGFSEPENLWVGRPSIASPTIYPDRQMYQQAGGLFVDRNAEVNMSDKSGNAIYYTLDGTRPGKNTSLYTKPFELTKTTVVRAKSIDKAGNESPITEAYFRVVKSGDGNGLKTTLFRAENLTKVPDFEQLTPVNSWTSAEFYIAEKDVMPAISGKTSCFAMKFEGFIQIEQAGKYTFSTASDDGSKLYVNGKLVVNNDGNHGVLSKNGTAILAPGKYPIQVEYYNNDGGYWLDVFYKGPGVPKQLIPADKLYLK
jgi:hypothetical protein